MTERFRVTISNTNTVYFVDFIENKQLMSITFKNKSDAIDCKNALMYQCDLLNAFHEENVKLQARNKYLATKIQRERNIHVKEHEKWEEEIQKENQQLKASLYAEKTNTAEVINEYAKQFKRHSSQFSFMIDLAEDLGIDVSKLEALDD